MLEPIEGTLLSRVINDRGDGAPNAEHGEDDDKKHCVWSFDKNVGQAKLLAHQIADLAEMIEHDEEQLCYLKTRIKAVQQPWTSERFVETEDQAKVLALCLTLKGLRGTVVQHGDAYLRRAIINLCA